jgi:Flp pilus assembly pilin Flp
MKTTAARRFQRAQRGQSSIEYVVVCAAIALTLGVGMQDGSVLKELVEAFRTGYQRISFALSLPI